MEEIWKPVVGWEGFYEVSNVGGVRSVNRIANGGSCATQNIPGRTLSPRLQMHGYLIVTLRRGAGQRRICKVHRLVAQAFIENPDEKPNVNHIDCCTTNNRVGNLEWCTQAENLAHMDALGRRAKPFLGKRSPNAFLSNDAVRALRSEREAFGTSYANLGRMFGLSKRAAMRCATRETYADVL